MTPLRHPPVAMPDPRIAEATNDYLHELALVRSGQGPSVAHLRACGMLEAALATIQHNTEPEEAIRMLRERLAALGGEGAEER